MSVKILHLTSNRDGNIGGAEKLLLDLHGRFDAARFAFRYANVFSLGENDNPYLSALKENELEYVNFEGTSATSIPKMFAGFSSFLHREKPDIFHTHLLHASIFGQFSAKLTGVKRKVITRHFTNEVFQNNRVLAELDKRAMQIADIVVAVSEAVKQDVMRQGISENKLKVIHNGIDLNSFDRILRQSAPPTEKSGEFLIGTVGSLTRRKGHEYLLSALTEVVKKVENIKLLIIGDGPEKERLMQITGDLGLSKNVVFMGFRNDIAELISQLDVYVHPSIYEPFGIAILEAMAVCKTVIATNVGGVTEIVVEGETGLIVPSANPNELADAILWTLQNTEKIKQMGEAGRRRVEQHFSIEKSAKRYEEMYEKLLS